MQCLLALNGTRATIRQILRPEAEGSVSLVERMIEGGSVAKSVLQPIEQKRVHVIATVQSSLVPPLTSLYKILDTLLGDLRIST